MTTRNSHTAVRPQRISSAVRPQRIRSLDGLRGVAALSVLIHHSLIVTFPQLRDIYSGTKPIEPAGSVDWWLTHSPLHLAWLGAESVYVFFILSGMVLMFPIIGACDFSWRRYYPSRLIRLYIPVWASLVFVVALTLAVLSLSPGASPPPFDEREYLLNPLRIVRDAILITGVSQLDGVLWSLRWEVLFSLLLPLYAVVALKWRHLWHAKLAAVLALAIVGTIVLTLNSLLGPAFFYMAMFGLGAVMAAELGRLRGWAEGINASSRPSLAWGAILVTAATLLGLYWIVLLASPEASVLAATRIGTFVGAGLLVFIAAFQALARRLLEGGPGRWLGRISFSLYLTHAIIIEVVSVSLSAPARPWTILIAIPIALLTAELFQRLVEAPSHTLAQRVKNRPIKSREQGKVVARRQDHQGTGPHTTIQ
jgi:peptidoglycan/LPS O-acetylase OafA/YrhL